MMPFSHFPLPLDENRIHLLSTTALPWSTDQSFPKAKWEPHVPGKATESPNVGSAERKGAFALLRTHRSMGTLSPGARKTYSSVCTAHKRIKQTLPTRIFFPPLGYTTNTQFSKEQMKLHL